MGARRSRGARLSRRAALLAAAALAACARGEDPVPGALRARLPGAPPDVREFYAAREDAPAWAGLRGVRPEADEALRALDRADTHGLDPSEYGVARLHALREDLDPGPVDRLPADRAAEFDLLLTEGLLRYGAHLSGGRLRPREVDVRWRTSLPDTDVAAELSRALQSRDPGRFVEALAPPHPGYAALREAHARLAAQPDWPAVRQGDDAALRARLGLRPGESLDAALREAQERHGIEPDGRPGAATLAALNVPRDERLRQVRVNLDRWRWIPRALGDPHVLVNLPGFDLRLMEGGRPALAMRIVAGEAETPTPVLSDRIVAVQANPSWTVPESIAAGEYLPKLRRDPGVLAAERIRLLDGPGEDAREIDPRTVDWPAVDAERFPYVLRQDPGPGNALGRIKFVLTNDLSIYLHDTPAGALFGRAERAFSHGCVRVEHPGALAVRLLGPGGEERLSEALASEEERRLPLPEDVPIHLLYWTAWSEGDGTLRYGPDVYGFDARHAAAMGRGATSRRLLPGAAGSGIVRGS